MIALNIGGKKPLAIATLAYGNFLTDSDDTDLQDLTKPLTLESSSTPDFLKAPQLKSQHQVEKSESDSVFDHNQQPEEPKGDSDLDVILPTTKTEIYLNKCWECKFT